MDETIFHGSSKCRYQYFATREGGQGRSKTTQENGRVSANGRLLVVLSSREVTKKIIVQNAGG